ncbi:spore germination protein GerPE [Siminovitchia sediminis]|uniref:Spore germination protein GerPE n=1 Tax=Siminovitchia sediminis TaxID=1274353 RepID=A0ABW4KP60_9BACI
MSLRNSLVEVIAVKSLEFSSIVEVGDTVHTNARSNALAVQRNKELFFTDEGNFQSFDTFSKPVLIPGLPRIIPSTVKYNECSDIKVGKIHIIGISSSAVIQVGAANHIETEARVLHIRQISNNNNSKEGR